MPFPKREIHLSRFLRTVNSCLNIIPQKMGHFFYLYNFHTTNPLSLHRRQFCVDAVHLMELLLHQFNFFSFSEYHNRIQSVCHDLLVLSGLYGWKVFPFKISEIFLLTRNLIRNVFLCKKYLGCSNIQRFSKSFLLFTNN